MAYSTENETRENLVEIRKNRKGDTVIVAKITDDTKKSESYDFRQWYEEEQTEELMPTKKGFRLNKEQTVELIKEILSSDKELYTEVMEELTEE